VRRPAPFLGGPSFSGRCRPVSIWVTVAGRRASSKFLLRAAPVTRGFYDELLLENLS
jgi:hypothetical protein